MTTATTAEHPFTARCFLFGEEGDAVETLTKSLHDAGIMQSLGGTLGRLSSAAHKAVNNEIARVGADLVDLDFVDILLAGWRKHTTLMQAARSSLAAPDTREVVDLATHHITSVHRPYVELLVDGTSVGKVNFETHLEFVVKALVATVANGSLTDLHCGDCNLVVSLACEGIQLVKRQGNLNLNLVVHLGKGLSLIPGPLSTPRR
jgi:hypothetical protein